MTRFAGCGLKCAALAAVVLLTGRWAAARVVYVDDGAPPGGDGTSWTTAYNNLNTAFDDAWADPNVTELRVAGGTYAADPNRPFPLRAGLTVAGGYAGLADPNDPDRRDLAAFATVLSGMGNRRIAQAIAQNETVVLDGLQMTKGIAARNTVPGGALWIKDSRVTVRDCLFAENKGHPSLGMDGGAVGCANANPARFIRCTFRDNNCGNQYPYWPSDGPSGGAVHATASSLIFQHCVLLRNEAGRGGDGAPPWYTYGGAGGHGGHIYAKECPQVELDGCLVAGGYSGRGGFGYQDKAGGNGGSGGAIYLDNGSVILRNCTIANNNAREGGQGNPPGQWGLGGGVLARGNLDVANTIAWGNRTNDAGEAAQFSNSGPYINYSCVEGWTGTWGGEGNHGRNPLFVSSTDHYLKHGSPCIDAGDNSAVPPEITEDLLGNPRFLDDPEVPDTGQGTPPIVDLGAYEHRSRGDANCDQQVNFGDVNPFVLAISDPNKYRQIYPRCPLTSSDVNSDGKVDFGDINPFVELLSR